MQKQHLLRFFEFFVVGVLFGLGEDLLAIHFSTGEPITLRILGIVILIAIPFAAISELIVDRPDVRGFVKRFLFGADLKGGISK